VALLHEELGEEERGGVGVDADAGPPLRRGPAGKDHGLAEREHVVQALLGHAGRDDEPVDAAAQRLQELVSRAWLSSVSTKRRL
jgi:hypothetical protein